MKKRLKISLTIALFLIGQSVFAESGSLKVIEHQINKSNLKAFSSQAVKFKDCNECPETTYKVSADATFFDRNSAISLSQATELYVKNPYDIVSLFINHSENKITSIIFGGMLERAEPVELTGEN
ncbi:MAG: hypothetical protein LRY66_13245 [Saccharospirillaceae bacterium]|nr:hypothetical protein [Saccharospirillaceae bacterium]MCD8532277.1 hypothetical protein [Saccharospirillaceae bacterium]